MDIRRANQFDIETMNKIQYQAATRIKNKKSTQWSHVLEGSEKSTLLELTTRGEVWVLEDNSKILGLMYLYKGMSEWDELLWNQDFSRAYYLHKFALSDEATGLGLADVFLKKIIAKMKKENIVIRLDCMASKLVLSNMYERVGFIYIDQVLVTTGNLINEPFNLYMSE